METSRRTHRVVCEKASPARNKGGLTMSAVELSVTCPVADALPGDHDVRIGDG
jgi:hypothetical protein